jgi:CheY-like chemotaxis protein
MMSGHNVSRFSLFGLGRRKKTSKISLQGAPCPDLDASTAVKGSLSGTRVLIVDDDAVFVKAAATKLKAAGCDVWTAKEGSEAIALLGERPVDVVLMDLDFPPDVPHGGIGSWDGFRLLSWLRCLPCSDGTRFIIVSVSDSPRHRLRARQAGAVAYLQKPVNYSELLAAVKRAEPSSFVGNDFSAAPSVSSAKSQK